MINDKPEPVFADVLKPAEYDCLAAGKLMRFLHDAVPSHPLFELAEDFQERFLSLQNVIKLYEFKCNRAIERIKNEWIDYHKKINDEIMAEIFTEWAPAQEDLEDDFEL